MEKNYIVPGERDRLLTQKCPCCGLLYFNTKYLDKSKEKLEKYLKEDYFSKLKKETAQLKKTLASLGNLLILI